MPKVDPYNAAARQRVLQAFIDQNNFKVQTWTKASGLSESVVRHFLDGATQSMSDRTYAKLASGASTILEREVKAAELRGEAPADVEIPVRSYIGAGDEIIIIPEADDALYWTPAPPGMEKAVVTEVRGRSMIPLYHDGDLLFHQRIETDPGHWLEEVVAVQVKGGRRFVKLLERGSRKDRFKLVSINPAFVPLEDQQVEWIAPIEWVRKRRRK